MSSLSLKRSPTTAAANEPVPKLGKRSPVPLMQLDFEKLEFGTKVEQGSQGDRFVRLNYEGSRLEIALKTLPDWARAPFSAGPPKTADGNALGTAWGMAAEMTMEEYEKWAAFEAYVVKKLQPMRNELFPGDAKKAGKGGIPENAFQLKFNSKLVAPNPDKGYAPNLRVFVETDPTKQMPKIQKMHLREGNKCTRPIKGDVNDLVRGAAVVMVISLVRGVYAGQTGTGMKFSATGIDILTNLQQTNAPETDYSGVEFLNVETPMDNQPPPPSAHADADHDDGGEDTYTQEQMDAAIGH
tara:strand:+ start:2091 stop:2984 length:894 start_codon:yes stop_codon:yes gene_type:complete